MDETWAGKDCSPQRVAQLVAVPLRFHVLEDAEEQAAAFPVVTGGRLAACRSVDSR